MAPTRRGRNHESFGQNVMESWTGDTLGLLRMKLRPMVARTAIPGFRFSRGAMFPHDIRILYTGEKKRSQGWNVSNRRHDTIGRYHVLAGVRHLSNLILAGSEREHLSHETELFCRLQNICFETHILLISRLLQVRCWGGYILALPSCTVRFLATPNSAPLLLYTLSFFLCQRIFTLFRVHHLQSLLRDSSVCVACDRHISTP